jgi:hypothetical protein
VTSQADVRRIALSLPEATEDADSFHFRVAGKGFAWVYLERVDPRRARVPRDDVIAVRVADQLEKDALLALDPTKFFTTDHYNGYPAILVRLPEVEPDELEDLLTDAWRAAAPRRLLSKLEAR